MHLTGYTADELFIKALTELEHAPIQEGRGEPTKELLHVLFQLQEPRNRLVTLRDINPAFAFIEVLWIMAGGNSVEYLKFWNPRMKSFAQPNGLLYGAYGHRLGCADLWNDVMWDDELIEALYIYNPNPTNQHVVQLLDARDALASKPNSRQIVLQIWDSQADLPDDLGQERAKDIPCNVVSHLLVRQGKLHWMQFMRSNDAIWGWPYNLVQWTFLQEIMAGWLGLDLGPFMLLSDSYHTYQKHWANIPQILHQRTDYYHYSRRYGLPFDTWQRSFAAMIPAAWELTQCELGQEHSVLAKALNEGMNGEFYSLMGMLVAEAMRIKGAPHEVYHETAIALMKGDSYWMASYARWLDAKERGVII